MLNSARILRQTLLRLETTVSDAPQRGHCLRTDRGSLLLVIPSYLDSY